MLFLKLFRKRYLLTTLLVLVAMAVMARLGIWQLDRRQQRLARNADIIAKLEQPPQSLNGAATGQWVLPQERDEIRNLQGQADGVFDFSHEILLLQQNLDDGTPGAHLVAPLVLEGSGQAVLVDRGWIPLDLTTSDAWKQFDHETGPVSVVGFLQPSQILLGRLAERAQARDAEQSGPHDRWYRVDIEAIQPQVPYPLLPVYLLQAPSATDPALPIRVEPEFDLSEGSHMSYALQWFSFAVIAGAVYVGMVRRKEAEAEAKVEAEAEFKQETEAQAEAGREPGEQQIEWTAAGVSHG